MNKLIIVSCLVLSACGEMPPTGQLDVFDTLPINYVSRDGYETAYLAPGRYAAEIEQISSSALRTSIADDGISEIVIELNDKAPRFPSSGARSCTRQHFIINLSP